MLLGQIPRANAKKDPQFSHWRSRQIFVTQENMSVRLRDSDCQKLEKLALWYEVDKNYVESVVIAKS